jgi:hypothetical protein
MGVDYPGTLLCNDWRPCHSGSPCLLSVFVPTDGFVLPVLPRVGPGTSERARHRLPAQEETVQKVFVVLNNGSYVDHDW